MSWANDHDASLDVLQQVQGTLTVSLIMVPRQDLSTCVQDESAAQIKARNENQYSFFPVVDRHNRVLGLYNAERWFEDEAPDLPIADDFVRLSEDIVIGADASIFDFVMQADEHQTNLVVSGNQIAGLVSLSDLQKLPVRAALFALITSLEMAMVVAIQRRWPQLEDWISFLSDGRKDMLLSEIGEAKAHDGFVSEIAFTQFSDKADILRKGKLLAPSSAELRKRFKRIRVLRDSVAHANNYAATPTTAKQVCETVRWIYEIKAELLKLV
ncbi:hypothetical protein [Maritalea mediterranea]|uniref:CBS domain-containing protein n=1 Tax=Maritalea mediterranea TaxID=2909667 RepID=A0ABS9E7P6_9HYPH|nr:hypothetical protein [Maritalea mediterranea]MCF4098199.1 hypothetical protein [Maritalea mediterranea]